MSSRRAPGRQFAYDPIVRVRPHGVTLCIPLRYGGITVPSGEYSDLASVPRVLWSIWPPLGRYSAASIVHDFLLRHGVRRSVADALFKEAMEHAGVHPVTRALFYAGVRVWAVLTRQWS